MEKLDHQAEFGTIWHLISDLKGVKIEKLRLNTNEVTLKAYLPILIPLSFEDFDGIFSAILTELMSLSEFIEFPLERYGTHQITIDLVDNETEDELLSKVWIKPTHIRKLKILKLSIDQPISLPEEFKIEFDNKLECISGSAARSLHLEKLITIFEERIYNFLIVTHIAYPGCLDVDEGYLFFNEKFYGRICGMHSSIREASKLSNEIGWPKLDKLYILDVWNWAKQIDDFISSISETELGRALCALSYLFKSDITQDDTLDIVWALIGLEALYCKNFTGIREQLTEKSQILLGEIEEHKRKFKEMYSFRSNFIHGTINFPSRYCQRDAEPIFEKFYSDNFQATLIAEAMLIATLQEMYKNKYSKLEFLYALKDC